MSEIRRTTRTLAWYEKEPGNRFVEETELKGADLVSLQQLFGVAYEDPMYDCYPVASIHLAQLQHYVDVDIDLGKYEYFVECRSAEV